MDIIDNGASAPAPAPQKTQVNELVPLIDLSKIDVSAIPEEQLDSVLHDLEALTLQTPIDYGPHAKQLEFHTSLKPIRFMCGGNQSGKTEGGVAEDMMHSTGIYPDWYPVANRFKTANKGRITIVDYGAPASVLEEKIWHWLPKHLVVNIQRTMKGAMQKILIRHVTGGISQIDIMTHEQADNAFESWTGHWAHFDEPPPREKFIATLRGLIAYHGRCWLTATPISEPWLYDEFIGNDRSDVFFVTVDIRDNPHITEADIAQFEASLTEDEKEARLHGRFRHLAGLVYKELDPVVHVIPASRVKLDSSMPTYFITDPHDRKPHFGIWAKVDPFGRIYIVDEIKLKATFLEYAKAVYLREQMQPSLYGNPQDVIRILDPNKGNSPSAVSGKTLVSEFADAGLFFTANVNDDITAGHLAVSAKLSYRKTEPLSTTNCPRLYFLKETTKEMVRYMQRYVWSDWRGSAKDEKGKKEKPMENFKDFPDCLRYLVMSNPCYFEQDNEEPDEKRHGGSTGYGE